MSSAAPMFPRSSARRPAGGSVGRATSAEVEFWCSGAPGRPAIASTRTGWRTGSSRGTRSCPPRARVLAQVEDQRGGARRRRHRRGRGRRGGSGRSAGRRPRTTTRLMWAGGPPRSSLVRVRGGGRVCRPCAPAVGRWPRKTTSSSGCRPRPAGRLSVALRDRGRRWRRRSRLRRGGRAPSPRSARRVRVEMALLVRAEHAVDDLGPAVGGQGPWSSSATGSCESWPPIETARRDMNVSGAARGASGARRRRPPDVAAATTCGSPPSLQARPSPRWTSRTWRVSRVARRRPPGAKGTWSIIIPPVGGRTCVPHISPVRPGSLLGRGVGIVAPDDLHVAASFVGAAAQAKRRAPDQRCRAECRPREREPLDARSRIIVTSIDRCGGTNRGPCRDAERCVDRYRDGVRDQLHREPQARFAHANEPPERSPRACGLSAWENGQERRNVPAPVRYVEVRRLLPSEHGAAPARRYVGRVTSTQPFGDA